MYYSKEIHCIPWGSLRNLTGMNSIRYWNRNSNIGKMFIFISANQYPTKKDSVFSNIYLVPRRGFKRGRSEEFSEILMPKYHIPFWIHGTLYRVCNSHRRSSQMFNPMILDFFWLTWDFWIFIQCSMYWVSDLKLILHVSLLRIMNLHILCQRSGLLFSFSKCCSARTALGIPSPPLIERYWSAG